ncbi:sensor histidine kinase [uncultured Ruthenibacterium sp.]|uniref:sensor histidine kinase n=1 Tax=uncultured Ruthenibacterium sp. TaxID=1905347 RepID=UPI00349E78B4
MDTKLKNFNLARFLLTAVYPLVAVFVFAQMFPYFESSMNQGIAEGHFEISALFYFGGFSSLYALMLIGSSAVGAVLAIPRPLGIGRGLWCRLPLEVYLALILLITQTPWTVARILVGIFNGSYAEDMQHIFSSSEPMEGPVNLLLASLLYLLFLCMFQVGAVWMAALRDGVWKYLRTHSLTVRLLIWIFKKCGVCLSAVTVALRRAIHGLGQVDLSAPVEKTLLKWLFANFLLVTLCCCLWFWGLIGCIIYSVILFFLLRKYMQKIQRQYNELLVATQRMAQGDLHTPVEGDAGIFYPLQDSLNDVRTGFEKAVEEEVRSRNMKTELITNVSHDLKTPLTAIITYVDLLKDPSLSEEKRTEYVATLDKKSQRLKRLIEDLFEVSKATSGNVVLHPQPMDLTALLKQVQYEMEDQLDASAIDFRWHLPTEKVPVILDGQRTCRIFENLLGNILKYAMSGTRAYIQLEEDDGQAVVTMKNISATELTFDPSHITERFVRGDASRNTEGSGLGLAIAQSFTELQGGRFAIETDGDLFKAIVSFPLKSIAPQNEPEPSPQ